ncbi:hypothetical protein [Clostridium celatum]|uniref:DUF3244 domain-containing protein n=1 Tax=Clostridium celatum DSM 1785 TaxID=545697 RepID=L1QL24_9CLOT|nr:hypothetical protein [Clostridium celatum]EKY28400.1 hypothetical protein HMPREF0216_00751 [Clostridium celatum DSM 1785]MCE9655164.1 hypothetical protein [Clostridium celatum]
MLKKIYFFIPLMLFITLPINVTANTISSTTVIPAVSNVYKEGFYTFDNLVNVDITVTLLSDTPTKIMILDDERNIEFISKIPYNYKFYIRNVEPGQIIGIVGKGEVALSFEPSK